MSRAFVNEDAADGPRKDFHLPPRDDPDYDATAASVLLEAARGGDTASAEDATGYRWGDAALTDHVRRIGREEWMRAVGAGSLVASMAGVPQNPLDPNPLEIERKRSQPPT